MDSLVSFDTTVLYSLLMVQDRKKSFHPSFLWLLNQTTVSVLVLVATRPGLLNILSTGLFLSIACVGSMKP